MDPETKHKTAFTTPDGNYVWNRMPFGLVDSPYSWQRLIDYVSGNLKWNICLVFLDDILIFAKSFEEHNRRLEHVLQALQNANLTLKPSKCQFGMEEVKYLGHIISTDGILPNPEKLTAVREFPTPTKVKD
ncbi:unnamed protein product, partial [Allacma fusca]